MMQANILVDHIGRARVTDFALARSNPDRGSTHHVTEMRDYQTRWTAPEILEDTELPTKEADIFSFSMVMVEVRRRHVLHNNPWPTCYFDEGFHWSSSIQSPSLHRVNGRDNGGKSSATAN